MALSSILKQYGIISLYSFYIEQYYHLFKKRVTISDYKTFPQCIKLST